MGNNVPCEVCKHPHSLWVRANGKGRCNLHPPPQSEHPIAVEERARIVAILERHAHEHGESADDQGCGGDPVAAACEYAGHRALRDAISEIESAASGGKETG